MATATAPPPPEAISQALVDFSVRGLFPADDATSTAALTPESLPAAIAALASEKTRLESDIHNIVESSADDVRSWIENAQALQVDIARRKTLATDIVIRGDGQTPAAAAAAGAENAHSQINNKHGAATVHEAEARAQFLTSELNYNLQVRYLLEAIQRIGQLLDRVETTGRERRILESLRLLEMAWAALDQMPVSKSCRAMRLLDRRAFELKTDVHAVFDGVWAALVSLSVDAEAGLQNTLTISQARDDEPMTLADAVVGFKAFKEVDSRMAALWHALDAAIVGPRMDLTRAARPALHVSGNTLALKGTADEGVDALFRDLEVLFSYLSANLPADLVQALSSPSPSSSSSSQLSTSTPPTMVSTIIGRIVDAWLVAAVPTSLDQMAAFEATLEAAQAFCARLAALNFTGLGRLHEWVESAPRVWLAKRCEAALDQVRQGIAKGLGTPHEVERIEKQMVSRSEGKELMAAAATTTGQDDWDTAWSDGEGGDEANARPAEDGADRAGDGADEWGAWGDDDNAAATEEKEDDQLESEPQAEAAPANDDDGDAADAWGWGEEDGGDAAGPEETAAPKPPSPKKTTTAAKAAKSIAKTKTKTKQAPAPPPAEPETRELILREKYHISSLPAPVLGLIAHVLEDALALTAGDHAGSSVATAAAGLFGVPALVLAMFRAVSPHFYALDVGGSMYLYNDAMYLAEELAKLVAAWTEHLAQAGSSAAPVTRLAAEAAKLKKFAGRAYGKEMAVQKTVLRDLLGGDDNVLQGSSGGNNSGGGHGAHGNEEDADDYVDAAVVRVRSMAAAWEGVLAPSAWLQAVGSLANAVAHKLILDVLDMPSISQDEAFSLAKLIQKVTALDDLFLPPESTTTTAGGGGGERVPMTSQYAPDWLRLQYLSEVLQSNLREVRYLWMESELSLYFTAGEVVDLIKLSFEDNARSREIAREITANPRPAHLG